MDDAILAIKIKKQIEGILEQRRQELLVIKNPQARQAVVKKYRDLLTSEIDKAYKNHGKKKK